MQNTITDSQLHAMLQLVKQASMAIMDIYNSGTTTVEYKADDSPLTQADKASHEIITQGLEALFPNIPIVSEEGDLDRAADYVASPTFWLVDPIDGTKEFINRTGEFCIAIGLIHNDVAHFGLVCAPTFDTVYYGGPGYGSFKKVSDAPAQRLHAKELSPHVAAMSRSHLNDDIVAFLDTHAPGATRMQLGSMLKQMAIAEGTIDIYASIAQQLKLWDIAAGDAIIAGAGGYMTRPDGLPLTYKNPDLLAGDFVARAMKDYKKAAAA